MATKEPGEAAIDGAAGAVAGDAVELGPQARISERQQARTTYVIPRKILSFSVCIVLEAL